ncbi:MAG: ATP-binding protein, partial [Saprospiraceae bacterium]|nr:ATP-binding protein [Saprospiraceae bacterium]
MTQSLTLRDSPPKYLQPYDRADVRMYPERHHALDRLYAVFKRTSLLVLHGPVGAGKTSLVNCAFADKIKISPRAIFYLRRQEDFLESIEAALKEKNLDERLHTNLVAAIDAEQQLIHNTRRFDDYNNMLLWLETKNPRFRERISGDIPEGITKTELVSKRDLLDTSDTQVKATQQQVMEDFTRLFGELKTAPLFIFDDFEDIFVYGTESERQRFGLFCQLLLSKKAPANAVVIVDEGYFG